MRVAQSPLIHKIQLFGSKTAITLAPALNCFFASFHHSEELNGDVTLIAPQWMVCNKYPLSDNSSIFSVNAPALSPPITLKVNYFSSSIKTHFRGYTPRSFFVARKTLSRDNICLSYFFPKVKFCGYCQCCASPPLMDQ